MPRLHRPLLFTAALMVALTVVLIPAAFLDDREITGAPIWTKPLKFSISIAIYAITIAWLIPQLDRRPRIAHLTGTVITVALLLEQVVIVAQALRGRASHFNVATPLDSALYSTMGLTIMILWVATAGLGILLLQQRIPDRVTARALRLGLLIALGGLSVGYLMTMPSAAQRAAMADAPPTVVGAHSVGVPDGGPGLPLVNWSTTGGDLRVGHFIGMHALQALPLLALGLTLLARRLPRLAPDTVRLRLVTAAAAGYAGLTLLVTWQALRGQSLIHPDAVTLVALTLIILGTSWGFLTAFASPPAHAPATSTPVPDSATTVGSR